MPKSKATRPVVSMLMKVKRLRRMTGLQLPLDPTIRAHRQATLAWPP